MLRPYQYEGAIKMRIEKNKVNRKGFEVVEHEVLSEDMERKCLPRMKSLKEMVELTGFSYHFLRNLCLQNKIVHVKTGKKYLINYDRFIDYLNSGESS